MAQFLNDTFTETSDVAVATHVGETGATWTTHASYGNTGTVSGDNDRVYYSSSASVAGYYASGLPINADYDVSGVIYIASSTTQQCGVTGRMSTSANTLYLARYEDDVDLWRLRKIVAGVATDLGSWTEALAAGNSRTVKLEMRGTTIKLFVDSVERISVTDSAITDANRAGIRLARSGASSIGVNFGVQIDSITASDPAAASLAFATVLQPFMHALVR